MVMIMSDNDGHFHGTLMDFMTVVIWICWIDEELMNQKHLRSQAVVVMQGYKNNKALIFLNNALSDCIENSN